MNIITELSKETAIKSLRVATSKTAITAISGPVITDSSFRDGYFQRLKLIHNMRQSY